MAIAQKFGRCIDCPNGSPEVPVVAGRCQKHYWPYRNKVNEEKRRNKPKNGQKQELAIFFANQALQRPKCCEECGGILPTSPAWMVRATIAHILPKRPDFGFPSVATHPTNKMFLCIDCHTNFDNLGEIFIVKMKLLPVIRERVAILIPFLTPAELNKVPEYLLQS